MGSASVSRGGGSRSGGVPALSWRDGLTGEGEGQTRGEETQTGTHTHTCVHTQRGWEVKRER